MVFWLLLSFCSAALGALGAFQGPRGLAVMTPTANSTVSGSIGFSNSSTGVLLDISLTGLKPLGIHAIHLHMFGDLSDDHGLAFGSHYNPTSKAHGCDSTDPIVNGTLLSVDHHVGDIGNVQADANGNVNVSVISGAMSLDPKDIGYVIGHGVIVHAEPDDCETQPTGNSGGRISQGVIGWALNGVAQASAEFVIKTPKDIRQAISILNPTNTSAKGLIFLSQLTSSDLVNIQVSFSGLEPSTTHGLHIHAFGDISNPAGESAGGHFNPLNTSHGCFENGTSRHAGDLDNIVSDGEGNVNVNLTSSLFSLFLGSKVDALGRGLILHSRHDDCVSQPVGNSGYRIAQGVIGYRNASLPIPLQNISTVTPLPPRPPPTSGSNGKPVNLVGFWWVVSMLLLL